MQHLKAVAGTVCTTQQIAELLGLSPTHLAALEKAGTIKRLGKNQWPLAATVQNYVRSVREGRRHDTSTALRDVRREQLRKLKLANDERERRTVSVEEAELVVDVMCGFVRTELAALPMRATRDLREQQHLEAEVDGCLNRIADKMKEQGRILREEE